MIAPVPAPPPAARSGELDFLDPAGVPVTMPAVFEIDHPVPPHYSVRSCEVMLSGAWKLVQYRLPAAAATDRERRAAFENEVGAGVAITRAVANGPYARLFRTLAGYEMDCDEPFVLYAPLAGPSLENTGGRALTVRTRRTLMSELLVALRLLTSIGLVHGDLRPATIAVHAGRPQLDRPGGAVYAGAPRREDGGHPFASAEQRLGAGRADCRDDLWSIAATMYWLVTGRSVDDGRMPDLTAAPELARSLGQCFTDRADDRPSALKVLESMGVRDPLAGTPQPGDSLAAGRSAFDSMMAAKRGGTR